MSSRCLTGIPQSTLRRDSAAAPPPASRLSHLRPGECCTVQAVPSVDLLPALGIRPGKRVSLVARSIAGGPLLVRVDGRMIAVDRAIARQITVRAGD